MRIVSIVAALLVAVAGCSGGHAPADLAAPADLSPAEACTTLDAAGSDPACALALGQTRDDYLRSPGVDKWYLLTTPASTDKLSLVHLTAKYDSPTPVRLSVTLLAPDGTTVLWQSIDPQTGGAASAIDLVAQYATPGAGLLVHVADDAAAPDAEPGQPFHLFAEVVPDPDPNEANGPAPTAIALAGTPASGTSSGVLAAPGDIDSFSVAAPTAGQILYVHVSAAAMSPPLPFAISYAVVDPSGKTVASGQAPDGASAADLATAQRIGTAGTWLVQVRGVVAGGGPVPGDLRAHYDVAVELLDDVDANEPNESATAAKLTTLSTPDATAVTVTGRLGWVGDQDWYTFDVPAQSSPTVLHYLVTPTTNGGRFAALPPVPSRRVRVVTELDASVSAQTCATSAAACPRAFDKLNSSQQALLDQGCQASPPQCLQSVRQEHPMFTSLRNFEGVLLVPPHATTVRWFLVVDDANGDWTDDRDYTVSVQWRSAPGEAARYSGGAKQTTVLALAVDDPTNASFPAPPGSATVLSGTLPYGIGQLDLDDPTTGAGIRAPLDYDAVNDADPYEIDLPAITTAPLDRTWELQWSVNADGNGVVQHDLALQVQFCDGSGGGCTLVGTTSGGAPIRFAYQPGPQPSWASPMGSQPIYTRTTTATAVTTTAAAYDCLCFEPRFVQGGKFFVQVVASDRAGWKEVPYSVRMALTSYPQSYLSGGNMTSCPPPTSGGCQLIQ